MVEEAVAGPQQFGGFDAAHRGAYPHLFAVIHFHHRRGFENLHPQRMGGGIADVEQIKRVGQQEYAGGNQRDKREKLPELGPAHVGNAARKPGKNAPGAIFRQQQGHSGQRHA